MASRGFCPSVSVSWSCRPGMISGWRCLAYWGGSRSMKVGLRLRLPGWERAIGLGGWQAVAAVKATTEPKLRRGVVVVGGGMRWKVTPARLGHGAAVEQAVDQALAGPELSAVADFWDRMTNKPVTHDVAIARSESDDTVARFVRGLAPKLA